MKTLHTNWSALANDCMLIILLCGTVGIALKFTTFFNHWVYFPSFPNILDATFLIFSVIYLTWKARRTTIITTKRNLSAQNTHSQ
ncbi:MAG: hypothetical protein WC325_08480 [Candidatus Bathyarchaeia archaeon]